MTGAAGVFTASISSRWRWVSFTFRSGSELTDWTTRTSLSGSSSLASGSTTVLPPALNWALSVTATGGLFSFGGSVTSIRIRPKSRAPLLTL